MLSPTQITITQGLINQIARKRLCFRITSMAHEANALSTYIVRNTMALKLSTGKTNDLTINAFFFFHTKSIMEETQLDRIASEFSLSTSLSLLESKNLLISLVESVGGEGEEDGNGK
ncbi:hypothetical protein FCV25MIE_27963 [Fagus crenata]